MLKIPILRWGQPYESLELAELTHFLTGDAVARISQANPGLLVKDLRQAPRARDVLRSLPPRELLARVTRAADLYLQGTLPLGDGSQTPEDFVRLQSASTGLPEHMCRANMAKNHLVLSRMGEVLECLTRGLDPDILARGYGVERRGVVVSYQAQTPVLGLVLPSNSPGVHTLWLPAIPLQVGLVLKPGSQEPWTPCRIAAALVQAGVPREAIGLYPGGHDTGNEVVARCARSMIFGSTETVQRYAADPRVQVHGPGFSKILLGDDLVDQWEQHLDLMVESVFANSGRSCINCSGVWASRHTREIAQALAERLGPVAPKPPEDPTAGLAAFTVKTQAQATHASILEKTREAGVEDLTARFGSRLVEEARCAYLRPWVVHCDSPARALAQSEYLFPFVSVVRCPQAEMLERIGPTLVATAITHDAGWQRRLIDAPHIDRLNLGPIPTIKLNWLQPHEGNIVDFLFRARALQVPDAEVAQLQRS